MFGFLVIKNNILVNDSLYLQDTRNSKEETYGAKNKDKYFLPYKNPHHNVIKFIHKTGHQYVKRCKLEKKKEAHSRKKLDLKSADNSLVLKIVW